MTTENTVGIFGIGVQRSATTWLFRALEEHPRIESPTGDNNKEIDFFSHNYHKGFDWYHRRWRTVTPEALDYSVSYWPHSDVPKRIHEYNPGAKLLLAVRDPIERAYSQHKLQSRRGNLTEETRSFDRALETNPSYLDQGRYASWLSKYLEYFDRSQIKIVRYETISASPETVLTDLRKFLDLGSDFEFDRLKDRVNQSRSFRSNTLKNLRFRLASTLRSTLGSWSVNWIKRTGLTEVLKVMNQKPTKSVSPPTRETVKSLREEFRPELKQFEDQTGLDVSSWLSKSYDDYSWSRG